jgi:hypothetical protein
VFCESDVFVEAEPTTGTTGNYIADRSA